MDLVGPVQSDEAVLTSLSVLLGPGLGGSSALESSVSMRMIDTASSSPTLDPLNDPDCSNPSDEAPSKLLEDDVYIPKEPRDIYKQPLGPDIYTDIPSSTQQLAEDYNISGSRCNVDSSVNPSICAQKDTVGQITGQHMPNCSQSDHQQPIDVGDFPIDNESSILSASNVYSGLLADSDLQSNVPDFQRETALSSLSGPLLRSILNHVTVADDHFHEPSLLPPEILAPSEGTLDHCLKSTITPHLPERQAALFLLRSSHASTDAYNNNTAGSGSELLTDETLTSHAENFACSHKNVPIDFALDHSTISQIDHAEDSAPSPDSETQDIVIEEDFDSSPPSSPSMTLAYMPSSSPIPSSSPVGPSFQTPPTSPSSSPVKDTQLRSNKLLTPGTHRQSESVPTDEGCTSAQLSGFADQDIQSIISPDISTSALQHKALPENSSNTLATVAPSGVTVTNTASSVTEPTKLDSNVNAHRLKIKNGIPYPKRPTIAAHQLQQKKLAQPFRSPILPQLPRVESKSKTSAAGSKADTVSPTPEEGHSQEYISSSSATLDSKIKYRTTRAATQFKSPLSAPNVSDSSSLVRLTPRIQALERKLQMLKRAVKVREDVQEEVLEGLVKKWTEAGREVAWEVWNLVKDNASSDGSKKRTFEGSWGWESPGDGKKQRGEETERNWGWDVVPISSRNEEEEEEDKPRHSLGTMLMQLGVAADTLGWNEEEGSFIER